MNNENLSFTLESAEALTFSLVDTSITFALNDNEGLSFSLNSDEALSFGLSNANALSFDLKTPSQIGVENYDGEYVITPTNEAQILNTNHLRMMQNVTVNPIPSNYGLITWNGSKLMVS